MKILHSSKKDDSYLLNAQGVCLLRAGDHRAAIDLYRSLVLGDSLNVDPELPPQFVTNFATALLLTANVHGCQSMLKEIGNDSHPSVARLNDLIARWRQRMGWWGRFQFSVYGTMKEPIELDGPPGELVAPPE
jgi:hypothetical protein